MAAEATWDELVEELAGQLHEALWIKRFHVHLDRLRGMASPSEKLVYFYLLHSEPQSFTTIRRALSLSSRTVDKALKRLLESRYIYLDERYLYWVAQPQ